MSREIKFRVWDDASKEMYYPNTNREGAAGIFVAIYGNKEKTIGWGLYNLMPEYRITSGEYLENVLMQYTGLKDKNGKEIYECDIVRILYTDWPSKLESDPRTLDQYLTDIAEIKVVQWFFNGFYVSHEMDGWNQNMDHGKHGYIEVIGNIYETPQLLNSDKNGAGSDTTTA